MSEYTVKGEWEGETLVWVIRTPGQDDHRISDRDLKRWFNQQDMPMHDRPNNGVIRQFHIDKYFASVLSH